MKTTTLIRQGETNKKMPEIAKRLQNYFDIIYIPKSLLYTYQISYYILLFQYQEGLKVDGIIGIKTWEKLCTVPKATLTAPSTSSETILDNNNNLKNKYKIPSYSSAEMQRAWGQPGDGSQHQLFNLPYSMFLSWDTKVKVTRVTFHKKAGRNLIDALTKVLAEYGQERIHQLGLDLLGGTYNFRKMRGGNSYSSHAYACAIDIDTLRNPFRARPQDTAMSKPEYLKFCDIMVSYGFKTISYDLQHFQAVTI